MTLDNLLSAADQQAVIELARRSADEHLTIDGIRSADRKADGSWVTVTDQALQNALRSGLATRFPSFGFLGEEMPAGKREAAWRQCLDGRPTWVVDPLDGTSNFRVGFPVFSVTIALLVGGRALFGLVYDPN
ncbi:MAG TPA: inositol monophosphatase family protein, partial [Wenzhouxiangella sp.]|nr:inositol monophosphatase family protein [Wenzhouxiangella sp.]